MIKFTISQLFKFFRQMVVYHGTKAGGPEFESCPFRRSGSL